MPLTRILIIDDEVSLSHMLKLTLERTLEYEVMVVNQGRDGPAAAREFLPDLILLDLMMPDVDGIEVADRLGEDPRTERIPVVFLTAVVQQAEVEAGHGKIGGRTFIAKPVEAQRVIRVIEDQLASSRTP